MSTTSITSFGFLSSFPPTQCGMATFTAALGSALVDHGMHVSVVRALESREPRTTSPLPIIAELIASDAATLPQAIRALNSGEVAFVQHEYGLYGGPDGSDVLNVLHSLTVPSVAIIHTVLSHPTRNQIAVLNDVIGSVDEVVVMTDGARELLLSTNEVRPERITIIPHGAAMMSSIVPSAGDRPLLLTWGLIGPGKGIEWAIDAMAELVDLRPRPLYLIAGRTHPKVLAAYGESYRQTLEERVIRNGVEDLVSFNNSYLDLPSLNILIHSADLVVLPYESRDQATSGVLVDAVAAGRPVISTAFPHAVELLGTHAGIIVDHQDPVGLAQAIRRVLTTPKVASEMVVQAVRIAPSLSWRAVSSQYITLANRLLQPVPVNV